METMNEKQLINEQAPIAQQINDAAVKSYFDNAKGGTAAAVSMMTHEFNLPVSSAKYRLQKEVKTINDWLNESPESGTALDVGCGAGAWTEIFASLYKSVTGIEQSNLMLKAAKERVAHLPNAKILEGDGRKDLPKRGESRRSRRSGLPHAVSLQGQRQPRVHGHPDLRPDVDPR